jgi:hypothetical protein
VLHLGALLAAIVVPLHVMPGPLLGVDIQVGNKPLTVAVDTTTAGLRLAGSALPDGSVSRTGTSLGASVRRGEEAYADVTIAGQLIRHLQSDVMDSVQPMIGSPAAGLLGIGMLSLPRGLGCCANPLAALPGNLGQHYILSASFRAPQLILDPDEATMRQFAMLPIGPAGWPQGCVTLDNILPYELCGPVAFNAAAQGITIISANPVEQMGPVAAGTRAHLRMAQWEHDFQAGRSLPISVRSGGISAIQLGLLALQQIDLLYDVRGHQIGVR